MSPGRVSGLQGLPEGCVQATGQERGYRAGKTCLGAKGVSEKIRVEKEG